jgi:hypothetical protein
MIDNIQKRPECPLLAQSRHRNPLNQRPLLADIPLGELLPSKMRATHVLRLSIAGSATCGSSRWQVNPQTVKALAVSP